MGSFSSQVIHPTLRSTNFIRIISQLKINYILLQSGPRFRRWVTAFCLTLSWVVRGSWLPPFTHWDGSCSSVTRVRTRPACHCWLPDKWFSHVTLGGRREASLPAPSAQYKEHSRGHSLTKPGLFLPRQSVTQSRAGGCCRWRNAGWYGQGESSWRIPLPAQHPWARELQREDSIYTQQPDRVSFRKSFCSGEEEGVCHCLGLRP